MFYKRRREIADLQEFARALNQNVARLGGEVEVMKAHVKQLQRMVIDDAPGKTLNQMQANVSAEKSADIRNNAVAYAIQLRAGAQSTSSTVLEEAMRIAAYVETGHMLEDLQQMEKEAKPKQAPNPKKG